MRFYLLDRITSIELGKSIEGVKCWSIDNEVFEDHFPGFPVVPGVLATESMAQLLGTLVEKTYTQKYGDDNVVYAVLSIIHKAKFKSFLIPGDKVILKGELQSIDVSNASGEVKMYVDDKLMGKASFSFGLLKKENLPNQRLANMREEFYNIVFNGESVRDRTNNA